MTQEHTPRQPTTAVPVLLQELTVELGRFGQGFGRRHHMHQTDVDALGHLALAEQRGDAMTPSRLAASLDLSAPATSALLNRLEDTGHVAREPDPDDGRRHLLRLQPPARALAMEYFGPLAASLDASLDGMAPGEVAIVEGWLARAVAATRDAVAEVGRAGQAGNVGQVSPDRDPGAR